MGFADEIDAFVRQVDADLLANRNDAVAALAEEVVMSTPVATCALLSRTTTPTGASRPKTDGSASPIGLRAAA